MKEIYVAVTRPSSFFVNKQIPLAAYLMQDYPNIESCEKELVSWYGKYVFDIYTLEQYIDTFPVDHFTYENHRCAVFKNNPDGKPTISSIPSFIARLLISKDINALSIITGFSVNKMTSINNIMGDFENLFLFGKKFAGISVNDPRIDYLDDFIHGYKNLDANRSKSIIVVMYFDTALSVITESEKKLYDLNHISILIANHAYLITIKDTEIKLNIIDSLDDSVNKNKLS